MTNIGRQPEAIIIGAGIADILVRPVDAEAFARGACAVESIRMSVGGDALNESTILARLGHAPMLATVLGDDSAADVILAHCEREGVAVHAARRPEMDTGVNVVLVSESGERSFVTNPNGSLRRLSLEDVLPVLGAEACQSARLVCLASMFVSPLLDIAGMENLFARVKAAGKILCADTTKRKRGETLADAACALGHLDYIFPNLDEARLLTGLDEPDAIADAFLRVGVKNVALKLGGGGCLLKNARERYVVPAYPVPVCLDTTGAGDNFAAAFIAAVLEGKSLRECGAFANAVASICVESLGATTAELDRAEAERRCMAILNR